ncbi:hypothetical protein KI387_009147, partial [Taxus chinensis]
MVYRLLRVSVTDKTFPSSYVIRLNLIKAIIARKVREIKQKSGGDEAFFPVEEGKGDEDMDMGKGSEESRKDVDRGMSE